MLCSVILVSARYSVPLSSCTERLKIVYTTTQLIYGKIYFKNVCDCCLLPFSISPSIGPNLSKLHFFTSKLNFPINSYYKCTVKDDNK